MGLLLGGIITVVGTSPLSSMALTALLGPYRYTDGDK